jgi:hypothetical protein
MLITPFVHVVEDGHEGHAEVGHGVFDFGWDGVVLGAVDESFFFKFFQLLAQYFVGDARKETSQFIVAVSTLRSEVPEDDGLPFSSDFPQCVLDGTLQFPC